jgi:hypothetical protein
VTLGDYEPSPLYPGQTATKTFTAFDPPDYLYATLENGSMPAVGTVVRLTWRNGLWWIGQDASGFKRAVIATSVVHGTGWRDGDGAKTSNPIIGWNGATNKAVKLFPPMTGNLSNDVGLVYTVKSSPSAYSDNWLVLEQDNCSYVITLTTIWGLPTLSLSDAQNYLRASGHTHTYDDNGVGGFTTGSTSPDVMSLTALLVGVESRIDFDSYSDCYETSTAQQLYYSSGATSTDMKVWSTLVARVNPTGNVPFNVNLKLTKIFGNNITQPYLLGCMVKVEQSSDYTP